VLVRHRDDGQCHAEDEQSHKAGGPTTDEEADHRDDKADEEARGGNGNYDVQLLRSAADKPWQVNRFTPPNGTK
jgi:hypothetical protein